MLSRAAYSALGLLAASSLATAQEEKDSGFIPRDTSEMLSAPPELITLAQQLEGEPPSISTRLGTEDPVIKVPVHMFVVSAQEKSAADFPQDDILRQQVEVLTNSFKPHFEFELSNITRKVNAQWAGGDDSPNMRRTLHEGDHRTLNLYLVDNVKGSDGGTALGTCHYPTIVRADPKLDGCSIRTDTLPSGGLGRYDLGITAVHEVGHFLGLAHTFDGGCDGGDKVADTPPEAKADYTCNTNLHSCGDARPDPVHNFMDYGPDACLDNFTPLQFQRMRRMWEHLRAPEVPPAQLNGLAEICLQFAADDKKCKEITGTCARETFPNGELPSNTQDFNDAVFPCVKLSLDEDNAYMPLDITPSGPEQEEQMNQSFQERVCPFGTAEACKKAIKTCSQEPGYKDTPKSELVKNGLFRLCVRRKAVSPDPSTDDNDSSSNETTQGQQAPPASEELDESFLKLACFPYRVVDACRKGGSTCLQEPAFKDTPKPDLVKNNDFIQCVRKVIRATPSY